MLHQEKQFWNSTKSGVEEKPSFMLLSFTTSPIQRGKRLFPEWKQGQVDPVTVPQALPQEEEASFS
jgi:hypothetical protein